MPMHLIAESAPLPIADVRFQIHYKIAEDNKTGIRFFMKPRTDITWPTTIDVYMAISQDGGIDDLQQCYLRIMKKALQYGYSDMIIPLFPAPAYSSLPAKEILYAVGKAYSEIDDFMDLYLLTEPDNREIKNEKLILDLAEYVGDTYEQPLGIRYSIAPSVQYSADYDDLTGQTTHTLESRTPLRFDPTRGFFQLDESFGETVLKLIEAKGMTEAQCYNKANISRAAFYKIRQSARDPKSTYRPTKQTAQALAIALELNIDEADDLLERAGYAFSHSNKGDIIVEYFLVNKIYDIFAVNEALYHYDQPLLGSL